MTRAALPPTVWLKRVALAHAVVGELVVTHGRGIADELPRWVEMRDGHVVRDSAGARP